MTLAPVNQTAAEAPADATPGAEIGAVLLFLCPERTCEGQNAHPGFRSRSRSSSYRKYATEVGSHRVPQQ